MNPPAAIDRAWPRAVLAGLRRRCPQCAEGAVFRGLLTVRERCSHCGLDLSGHRADDLPAYLAILVTGHILLPGALLLDEFTQPAPWALLAIMAPLAVALALAVLPPIKGAVIGLQWAKQMHGFAGPDDLQPIAAEADRSPYP